MHYNILQFSKCFFWNDMMIRVTEEVTESLDEKHKIMKRLFPLVSCRGVSAPGILRRGRFLARSDCGRVEK